MKTGKLKLKDIIIMALFVALSVVLKRFMGINSAFLSISFGFVPVAMAGMLYGPLGGVAVGALADLVGAILFPFGELNLLFTLSAGLSGLVYGLFLGTEKVSLIKIIFCQLTISFFLHLGLNTYFISIMYDRLFIVLFQSRLVKNLAMLPLEVAIIYAFIDLRPRLRKMIK